jgi:hypothetical protein
VVRFSYVLATDVAGIGSSTLKRRFRFPICNQGVPNSDTTGLFLHVQRTHFLSGCAVGRERIGTHNEMLEALNSMCKSAGCFTVTEAKNTFILTDPDNRTRPDIVVGGSCERGARRQDH